MIHHGDLFDVLPTLDAESIDAGVTDPPYGIGFMGREWDTFNPAKAVASKKHAITTGSKGRRDLNPNTRGRRQSPAMSPSQIEYDRSLLGQREFQAWTERWGREVLRALKPGAYVVVCGAPRSYHRMASGLEDAGFVVRDSLAWIFGQGFPKSLNLGDGKGTALKPAYEPIVLAWKPFKGTITANVAKHGTGALNIDACRLSADGNTTFTERVAGDRSRENYRTGTSVGSSIASDLGRWPANVLLDEVSAAMLDAQTGERATGGRSSRVGDVDVSNWRAMEGRSDPKVRASDYSRDGDTGGPSRFYYIAKPSREERDYGTEGLTARQRDESRKTGNPGGDNPRNRGLQPRGNFHPTVKPVELMRWLVKLVTPPGGIVLDPFTGSGTTGMACRYEQRQFIGIEREADYIQIAERRIAAVAPLFAEASA